MYIYISSRDLTEVSLGPHRSIRDASEHGISLLVFELIEVDRGRVNPNERVRQSGVERSLVTPRSSLLFPRCSEPQPDAPLVDMCGSRVAPSAYCRVSPPSHGVTSA